jgi:hypothetical protein
MKLSFPYRQQSLLKSAGSGAPGGVIPYRPFVAAKVHGPNRRAYRFVEVLVDSGSVVTIFPYALANLLGVALQTHNQAGEPFTLFWRGLQFDLSYGTVEVELRDDQGGCLRWPAEIGFTKAPLSYRVLGQKGALEYLDATFRFADLALELEPNRLFPGTASSGSGRTPEA